MKRTLGLALGSGSARGWAHIGVIRALAEHGIVPDVVCGCSIGAFVGAALANGDLDRLEQWVVGLAWTDVLGLVDVGFSSGLIKGNKLMALFESHFEDRDISQLQLPFACVATELATGHEVWLREGSVAAAVRASIAMPGVLKPVQRGGRLLVDGGLVNPVPVSLCRALGAEVVIGVDLGADLVGSSLRKADGNGDVAEAVAADTPDDEGESSWVRRLGASLGFSNSLAANGSALPNVASVLATSIQIMQTRISRSRLAGEPADVLLSPRLARLALMDFHRGADAISEGRAEVERMLPAIQNVVS